MNNPAKPTDLSQNLHVQLKPFQSEFVYSEAKFPGFVSAWGTGKTMSAILRGMLLSENVPNNVGAIIRRNYTDLESSTMIDFERYTGTKISSKGDVKHSNGSIIMFMPGDDLDKLKNINLGWFYIEQAEEFENADAFDYLRGRLRLKHVPFLTGFIIANANGHNWIYKRWIQNQALPPEQKDPEYHAVEATTYDNAENLPESYIQDCEKMKKDSPAHFRRFVMNSHDESDTVDSLVSSVQYDACKDLVFHRSYERRAVSVDVARYGDDDTIIFKWINEAITDVQVFKKQDTMVTAGHVLKAIADHKASICGIDGVGVGAGVVDRVSEMVKTLEIDCSVMDIIGGSASSDPKKWADLNAEMADYAKKKIEDREVVVPDNEILKEDLTFRKYRIMSDKRFTLEKKDDFKKRLKRSPNYGDAFMYGLWILQFARDEIMHKENKLDHYKAKEGAETSSMSA